MKIKRILTLAMLILGASLSGAEAIEEAKYEVLIEEKDFRTQTIRGPNLS